MKASKWRVMSAAFVITLCLLCIAAGCFASESKSDEEDLRPLFESRYRDWLIAQEEMQKNSMRSYRPLAEEGVVIIEMGPKVVEFLIEKLEQELEERSSDLPGLDSYLICMISIITLKDFPLSERTEEEKSISYNLMEKKLYVNWWREGRKQTPDIFAARYKEWDRLIREGKSEEANNVSKSLHAMGIDILPLVMQKISEGDERLVPFVSKLMRKEKEWGESLTRAKVLDWWKANESKLKLPDFPVDSCSK